MAPLIPDKSSLRTSIRAAVRVRSAGLFAGIFFLTCLLPNLEAAADEQLATVTDPALSVAFMSVGNSYELALRPRAVNSGPAVAAHVFWLENPSRLVIDADNIFAKTSRNVPLENPFFSALRLGAHGQKIRVVIDIKNNLKPEFSLDTTSQPGTVLVMFRLPAEASQPGNALAAPTPERPVPETVEPDQTKPPEAETPPPQRDTKTNTLTAPSSPDPQIEIPDTAPAPGTAQLRGIYYQATKENVSGAVRFVISGLSTYSLSRKDANHYELLLEHATLLGDHLTLPQFPPDTFQGFNVIMATQQGANIRVNIFVDDNIKLTPFVAQGQLWLRVGE